MTEEDILNETGYLTVELETETDADKIAEYEQRLAELLALLETLNG